MVEFHFENPDIGPVEVLDPALRLMIQTRRKLDPGRRARTLEADLIGSAFFEATEAVSMRDGALDEVMNRINEAGSPVAVAELPDYLAGLPGELRRVVSESLEENGWLDLFDGVRILPVDVAGSTLEQSGGNVILVEMEAGACVDRHRHLGEEYSLVLKGVLAADGDSPASGTVSVGSLVHRRPGSVHRPIAAPDEACAALVIQTGAVEFLPQDDDRLSA